MLLCLWHRKNNYFYFFFLAGFFLLFLFLFFVHLSQRDEGMCFRHKIILSTSFISNCHLIVLLERIEMYWPSLSDIIIYSSTNVIIPVLEWYMTLVNILLWNIHDPVTGDCVVLYKDQSCLDNCNGNNLKPCYIFIDLYIIIPGFFVFLMIWLINVLGHMMISLFGVPPAFQHAAEVVDT